MSGSHTIAFNRKNTLRQKIQGMSEQTLRISMKHVLQECILMETSEGSQLYVPSEKTDQVLHELERNFHCQFKSDRLNVWSYEKEGMVQLDKIDLLEEFAAPIRDGIAKDTVKFALDRKLAAGADIDMTLTEIIDQTARQRG